MILSIALNPVLTNQTEIDNVKEGEIYNSEKIRTIPEGGGINIGKIVKSFNEEVMITGFLGGYTGENTKRILDKLDISNSFIKLKDETRRGISIVDKNTETKVYGYGPRVSSIDLNLFYSLYKDLLKRFSIVTISGNLAQGCPKDTFRDLILLAQEENKKVLFDGSTYSREKFSDIKADLMILNIDELSNLVGLRIESLEDLSLLARAYIDEKNRVLVINRNYSSLYAFTKDEYFIIDISRAHINNKSSFKDGFLAGYAVSSLRNYSEEYKYKLAAASSISSSSSYEGGYINIKELKRIISNIDIKQVNY